VIHVSDNITAAFPRRVFGKRDRRATGPRMAGVSIGHSVIAVDASLLGGGGNSERRSDGAVDAWKGNDRAAAKIHLEKASELAREMGYL
jgi:hypothetical protein